MFAVWEYKENMKVISALKFVEDLVALIFKWKTITTTVPHCFVRSQNLFVKLAHRNKSNA